MNTTVEVRELTKRFGDFTAVDNASFEVSKGEIFGFLGPNGAGKSTTIRMLCGIITPTSGSGRVAGRDIMTEQDAIKNLIGYMSQKFSLYDELTIRENLVFFGSIYGLEGKQLRERIGFALDLGEITERRDTVVKQLPGGVKQRLALGAAVLHDPPILFLDEPTSGVDPLMRRTFWDMIYRFSREGKTIFVTTHYMDEAEHCDRMALIIAGKIIALDSPAGLKEELPYSVYTLRVPGFIEVFSYVNGLPFVKEAAIFGSDIHLLCERDVPLARMLSAALKEKGIRGHHIEKINPTLEDVFVTHARKHGV